MKLVEKKADLKSETISMKITKRQRKALTPICKKMDCTVSTLGFMLINSLIDGIISIGDQHV